MEFIENQICVKNIDVKAIEDVNIFPNKLVQYLLFLKLSLLSIPNEYFSGKHLYYKSGTHMCFPNKLTWLRGWRGSSSPNKITCLVLSNTWINLSPKYEYFITPYHIFTPQPNLTEVFYIQVWFFCILPSRHTLPILDKSVCISYLNLSYLVIIC